MKIFIFIIFLCTLWSGIAFSHDEEKYTSDGGYKIKSTNKHFVNISDQKTLTYENEEDDISGRFLYDQEDITDDYQVHIIYILASNSEDKKYDVNGTIEKLVLTGNEYLKSKTDGQKFRLDFTKEGKLDVSFIRVDKKKKKINRIDNGAGYFAAEAVKRGFYNPKKLYAIFYQDKYQREWGQVGDAFFYGPNEMIEVSMGVTFLGENPIMEGFHPYVHELIHVLGFVQLCAPGVMIDDDRDSKWGIKDHLEYEDDIMSDRGSDLDYMDRYLDKNRIEYYGHSIPNCEMDLKKSAFLEPTEKYFQLQPRSKSCKLTRWQPEYNHQRSLDCLARLNF